MLTQPVGSGRLNRQNATRDHGQTPAEAARGTRMWRMLMLEECRLRLVGNPVSVRRDGSSGRRRGGVVAPMPTRKAVAPVVTDPPRRGAWGGRPQTFECVESADDIVNRSDRTPLSPPWSQAGASETTEKKAANEANCEMRNVSPGGDLIRYCPNGGPKTNPKPHRYLDERGLAGELCSYFGVVSGSSEICSRKDGGARVPAAAGPSCQMERGN
jgi:hypothetical protein